MKQLKKLLSFLLAFVLMFGYVPASAFAQEAPRAEAAEIVVSFEIYDEQSDQVALLYGPEVVQIQEGDNGEVIAKRLLGAENVGISSGWMNSFTIDEVEYSAASMGLTYGSWLVYKNNANDSVGPSDYVPADGDVYRFVLTSYDPVTYEMPVLANDMDALYWAMAKSSGDLTSANALVQSEAPSQAAIDAMAVSLSNPGGKHYVIIDQRTVQVDTTGSEFAYIPTLAVDKGSAEAGETVTVTVTAPEGLTVKDGTLKANGTALTKVNDTTYTFEMPDAHVSITAEFEADDSTKLTSAEFFYDADGEEPIAMVPEFDKDVLEYAVDVLDQDIGSKLYTRVVFPEGATAKWDYYMSYSGYGFYSGGPSATSGAIYGHSVANMLYPGMTNGFKHKLDLTSAGGLVTTYYFKTTLYPTLSSLEIDGEELADFDYDVFEYEIEVPEDTESITINATPYDEDTYYVYIDGDDEDAACEDVTVPITGHGQIISIVVDDDQGTTKEYTVKVNLEGSRLSDLAFKFGTAATASVYTLEPEFDPMVKEYTVYVPDYTANVYGYATLEDGSEGTIKATYANVTSGAAVEKVLNSGGSGVSLANLVKSNSLDPVSDVVISIGGVDVYTVHVRRQATLTSGTNGFTLKVDGTNAVLTPSYNRTTYEYDTNQPADVVLTLTAKPTVAAASLKLNGTAIEPSVATEITPVWTDHGFDMVLEVAAEGAKSGIYTFHVAEIPSALVITTAPSKLLYNTGDDFDPAGMVVTAQYANNDEVVIPLSDLTITPSEGLTLSDTEITISYNGASVVQPISFEAPFDGSGTEDDPFQIKTAEDMNKLDAFVEGGEPFAGLYLKMMNDITLDADFNGVGFGNNLGGTAGTYNANTCKAFSGDFDGGEYTLTVAEGGRAPFDLLNNGVIHDLNVYGEKIDDNGVVSTYIAFPSAVSGGEVTLRNVTLKSGSKTLKSGMIGGYGNRLITIDGCVVEEGVTVGYNKDQLWVGGIAGEFNGTITNSTCDAEVYGVMFVGGIVADKGQSMQTFVIDGCKFGGTLVASGEGFDLDAYPNKAMVKNFVPGAYAGGICGAGYGGTSWGMNSAWSCPGVTIRNCEFTGSVTGTTAVGGIFGGEGAQAQAWDNGPTFIQDNTSRGAVSGTGFVGGDIGYMISLNKNDFISGNTYNPVKASKGIGAVGGIDTTGHETGFAEDGTFYFCTKVDETNTAAVIRDTVPGTALQNYVSIATLGSASYKNQWKVDHHRDDDPLGEDAYDLCRPLESESIEVKVTLSNAGSIEVANEVIEVEDKDFDGKYTADEVFVAVHDAKYPGGAEAGYATADYGYLAITKLWGVENGGGYGYYNNNRSLYSLGDEIKEGDHFVAFVYKDTENWSDAYCYFDKFEYEAEDTLTVTLTASAYDENWNLVQVPVHGAELTLYTAQMGAVDPSAYRIEDNGDGTYTILFYAAGNYKLVGTDDVEPLVPAVADVTASSAVEKTELTVINITNMFKGVKAHLETTSAGDTTLVFSLSGSGYHYLYPGTYEEAVANDDQRDNWVSGYQNGEGKWEFRMPVNGDGVYPVTAISQSYLDKYEQGLNPLARAFYPRQITLDLTENTATFDDYHKTTALTINNSVSDFAVSEAELLKVGGPNSNGYSSTLTLTMGDGTFDKVFIGNASEAAAAADTIAIGDDHTADIQVMWINTVGDPSSVETYIGRTFAISFHSAEDDEWHTVLFTIDEYEASLTIQPVTTINVFVTISDKGEVKVANEAIEVADLDADGNIDADEVLIAVHNAKYEGGAAAGYATELASWGDYAITKLWGVVNGGGYGYYNNNQSMYSLSANVNDGDHFTAFIYGDLVGWTDTYSAFDSFDYEAEETLTVTLNKYVYDYDSGATVAVPHAGADVKLYAEDLTEVSSADYKAADNGDGTYTLTFYKTGDFKLIGSDEAVPLVPAVSDVTVTVAVEKTDVTVTLPENYPLEEGTNFTVDGNVVTVTYDVPCKVGYLDEEGRYVAIEAVPVEGQDNTYTFTAPEGVTDVVLVIKGDANLNGEFTNNDITLAKATSLGRDVGLTDLGKFAADLSGDGELSNYDITLMKAASLRKIDFEW